MYEVRPESGKGRVKVLHRNLLLPIPSLPVGKAKTDVISGSVASKDSGNAVDTDVVEPDSISDTSSETSFTVRPRPVPRPRRTTLKAQVSGQMEQTAARPMESFTNSTADSLVVEKPQSVLDHLEQEPNDSDGNSTVQEEPGDSSETGQGQKLPCYQKVRTLLFLRGKNLKLKLLENC